MTKKDLINYINSYKRVKGYTTHVMLLELFDDNEDIPEYFKELVVQKIDTKPIYFLTGIKGNGYFNKELEEEFKNNIN